MCEEKGLDSTIADKIGEYVKHKGMSINAYIVHLMISSRN